VKAFPRDIEVQTLNERHIGVESELKVTTGGMANNSDECDCDSCAEERPTQELPDEEMKKLQSKGLLQSVGWDGGGREFRTNPISIKSLLKQKRGQQYITMYYNVLMENTEVVETGGTHIHISILDKDHANMESNAYAMARVFYAQFQKIAGRQTHWARVPSGNWTTTEQCKQFCDSSKYSQREGWEYSRTYGLKGAILAPTRHKTLEFRGPKGSNNAEEVLAWIDFLNNVVNAANRKSIDGVVFGDLLKTERIAKYVKGLKGWRKLSKSDLKKTINANKLT